MNKLLRRLKSTNKFKRFLFYIINIVYLVTYIIFVKNILSLSGIETVIRIILILFFILYLVLYILWNIKNLIRRKNTAYIITTVISIIFIVIFSIASYYIDIVYSTINGLVDSNELLYTSYLINLTDSDFTDASSIGIISSDASSSEYELSSNLYSNYNLSLETIEYDDYVMMLDDLYAGVIDSAIVPGNYITLFDSEEGFENIENETKIVYTYSETRENSDLTLTSTKDFTEPLTFLILGVDSETDGLNANASFNGDTLMVISINPSTLDVVMLSIPRDTYVPIACKNNQYAKINSSAAYGTSCVIDTISNFLDIDIDYYVKINFKGVVELVDALGGIEVDVEAPDYTSYNGVDYGGQVCEQNSNREYGTGLVCMDTGLQTLNGEQALAYARNRHLYYGGDLDRIKHQQQVVEAIASKMLSSASISEFESILSAVSNNIATNMDTDTILSGYTVIKNVLGNVLSGTDALSITKAYLETYSLYVYVPSQGRYTSAQGYYTDSLEDIKSALKVVLGEEKQEVVKTFSYSVNTIYEAYSPGEGIKTGSSGSLLPSFIGYSVDYVKEYCDDAGIDLTIEYVDQSSTYYNSGVSNGLVANQSEHSSVLLSTVSTLTIYVNDYNDSLNITSTTEENTNNDSSEEYTTTEEEQEDSKTEENENEEEEEEILDSEIEDLIDY